MADLRQPALLHIWIESLPPPVAVKNVNGRLKIHWKIPKERREPCKEQHHALCQWGSDLNLELGRKQGRCPLLHQVLPPTTWNQKSHLNFFNQTICQWYLECSDSKEDWTRVPYFPKLHTLVSSAVMHSWTTVDEWGCQEERSSPLFRSVTASWPGW